MRSAVGCDFSTHAVHLARVSSASGFDVLQVNLKDQDFEQQLVMLQWNLGHVSMDYPGLTRETFLVESPYFGHGNAATAIKLSRLQGVIETLAVQEGFDVRSMSAAEWRPLAGVTSRTRKEAKQEAIRLVELEYGIKTDDNAAEAILIARVALGLQAREAGDE